MRSFYSLDEKFIIYEPLPAKGKFSLHTVTFLMDLRRRIQRSRSTETETASLRATTNIIWRRCDASVIFKPRYKCHLLTYLLT